MADSSSGLIAKIAALLVFVAAGAGFYAFKTHESLENARAHIAIVVQERDKLKNQLIGTGKTVLTSSSELQMCTRELQAAKGRTASNAPPSKGKPL